MSSYNIVERLPFIPKNLSYVVQKMSGYTRQKVQLVQQNATSVNGGGILQVQLPENAIVDLSTLCMFFTPKTTSPATKYASINDAEDIINRVNIRIGSLNITNVDKQYNRLYKLLRKYQMGDKSSVRTVVNAIHKLASAVAVGNDLAANDVEYAITNWIGAINTLSPNCIDTSLFPGPVTLEFVLAGAEALVVSDETVSGYSYKIENIRFECDIINMPSVYYDAIQARLDPSNPLELPFQNFASFSSSAIALTSKPTVNWSYASESIDAIIALALDTTSNVTGAPRVQDTTHMNSKHWKSGSALISTVNHKINGLSYPSYGDQTMTQSFVNTYHNLVGNQDTLGASYALLNSLANYKGSYFMNVVRLNHENGVMSGLNTKCTSISGTVQMTGSGSNTVQPLVYVVSTARILVAPNKQIEVRM